MKNLFKATIIVTIFSVLTRALGFLLRIILSRNLGAETLGYYQVAMSVLGVLMTLIASGIPLIVSRSVAYNKSINNQNKAFSTVSAGLIYSLIISIIVSIVIFLFPNTLKFIGIHNNTIKIILFALPSIIASAVYCILRSALWGDKHFFAISFTEFFEQVVRIILCFILFSSAILPSLSMGEKASLSLSIACIASCVLVIAIYFALKQKLTSPKGSLKPLIKGSFPITTLRTISSLVQSLIALIIPARLMLYGYNSAESMAQFGLIMGMAFPLIMIPGTLISSLAVTLVPEISSNTDNIDKNPPLNIKSLRTHITTGLNLSIIISSLFIPAFIVLGEPICEILFKSPKAGIYVRNAAIIMLPMGMNQITSSMLNALGLELKSLFNYVLGATILFLSICFLPQFIGTNALIIGMGSMSCITTLLNIYMLKKRNVISKGYLKTIFSSLIFSIISAIAGFLIFNLLIKVINKFVTTIIVGIICVGIMFLLFFIFNTNGIKGFFLIKRKRQPKSHL